MAFTGIGKLLKDFAVNTLTTNNKTIPMAINELNENLRTEYKNYVIKANNGTPTATEVTLKYNDNDVKVNNSTFCYRLCCRTIGTGGNAYAEYSIFNNKVTTIFAVGTELGTFPSVRIDSYGTVKLFMPNIPQQYTMAVSVEATSYNNTVQT